MLDDLKYIHDKDAEDALGVAQRQWQQLEQEYEVSISPKDISNIVFAGMGGSALGALIAQSWPGFNLPFQIVRNYDIPEYVDSSTLFVASSYSGNTEETISALGQAEEKGAQIAVITSGGKLADIAKAKNYALLLEPGGLQPRYALWLTLKALLTLTDAYGVTRGRAAELASKGQYLKELVNTWLPTVPTDQNRAKQIAQELMGKSAVVYSGPKLSPAAYKWKISFNENAKHIAWFNQFPELNHNEMLGWTKQPVDKPYGVIELRSQLEHERVQKRFLVTARVLSGLRPEPIIVEVQGNDLLEQLLWSVALGDFVTMYEALLSKIDPSPVELIAKFKNLLDE